MARTHKQSQHRSAQTNTRARTTESNLPNSEGDGRHTSDSMIRANERKQQGKAQLVNENEHELADILFQRYGSVLGFSGVSPYIILMLLLAAIILWTGVQTATQIQQYREDYKSLQDMKQDYQNLQVENQRLLIEQQTFSATPQIATRAVSELGMFYPSFQNKLILQPISYPKNTTDITNDNNGEVQP